MNRNILLVGHCGIDGPRIQEVVESLDDKFTCRSAADEDELEAAVNEGVDLILLNRQLTGRFEAEQGIDLIRKLKQAHPHAKVMLVSDYPEAQQEAVQAGALPGFGKADLDSDRFTECIRTALSH